MMCDWLSLIGCVKKAEQEYILFGRYVLTVLEELTITDSFDDFKLLGSENIKEFRQLLDFVEECIMKAKRWN